MHPSKCHVNFTPMLALTNNQMDFDLFELEKMNFGFKLEQAKQQCYDDEVKTPTFTSDQKLKVTNYTLTLKQKSQTTMLIRTERKKEISLDISTTKLTTKQTLDE